ncbi:MATE family efflux transporter [Undibacterium parvum]|uniref:MATE family efflux transporter n=1 Tax=Undibacterium parvum TaxID=401471 RepID=A0A3S9HJ62_9BURK|nr:MATE family efflux transporter [Undibacterium parvum]AZP12150.1 MATE family efflux transporter [Undibacterium parvum]
MSLASAALPDMKSPHLKRLLFTLALPAMIGLSANAMHQLANAYFVSQLGTNAIAAVSICFPLLIIFSAIGEGAGIGVASAVARMLGAGQQQQANRSASTVMLLLGLAGCVLAAVLVPLLPTLLRAMGSSADALPASTVYATIFCLSAPLILLQMLCDFIAISEGNSRFSMWTLLGSFALNVILDPILIFHYEMGVAGAAWATLLSALAALIAYAFYFYLGIGKIEVAPRHIKIERQALWQVVSVGVPAAMSTGLAALAFALIYRNAATYGNAAVAAVAISLRILTGGSLPLLGFCLGAQALLGFAWGSGQRARFLQATRLMLAISSAFAISYAATVIVFAPRIVSWFTSDTEVQALAVSACRAFHLCFGLFGFHMVAVVALQAAERSGKAAWLVLAPHGYLLIPLLFLLPPVWGLDGLLASMAIAAGLSAALGGLLLFWEMPGLRQLPAVQVEVAVPTKAAAFDLPLQAKH